MVKRTIDKFIWNKVTNTFTAEISDLYLYFVSKTITILNPKTGNEMEFKLYKTDTDGEDVFGWRYKSNTGIELLIIND